MKWVILRINTEGLLRGGVLVFNPVDGGIWSAVGGGSVVIVCHKTKEIDMNIRIK